MLQQIKIFEENALALELSETFTEADSELIKKLFEEKLNMGYKHVNILIKVKDLSILRHMDLKAFFTGEVWGFKHFGQIGRCAVVTKSNTIKSAITVESKILHLFSKALEEKYFDYAELDDALKFIEPNDD